eukprot:scaffold16412_cov171-Amphora_coffeaeformis.AAC.11
MVLDEAWWLCGPKRFRDSRRKGNAWTRWAANLRQMNSTTAERCTETYRHMHHIHQMYRGVNDERAAVVWQGIGSSFLVVVRTIQQNRRQRTSHTKQAKFDFFGNFLQNERATFVSVTFLLLRGLQNTTTESATRRVVGISFQPWHTMETTTTSFPEWRRELPIFRRRRLVIDIGLPRSFTEYGVNADVAWMGADMRNTKRVSKRPLRTRFQNTTRSSRIPRTNFPKTSTLSKVCDVSHIFFGLVCGGT